MKACGTLRPVPSTLRDGATATWELKADPHVTARAKRVFGRLRLDRSGAMVLSHTAEVCRDLEWFRQRYPLEMEPADEALLASYAAGYRDRYARLSDLVDPRYTPTSFDLALPPRDYQAREARIYLETGGLLIADDVGLGKTAAAICSFLDPRTLPAVVVTLAHLPRQWAYEIEKFAPALRTHIIQRGKPYPLPTFFGNVPDVVIINYHKLATWASVLAAYGKSIVFDEIQELRHPDSQKASAATFLASAMRFKLGLSATPIFNFGGEIFNILDVLRPGELGTRAEFDREWCSGGSLREPRAFGTWAREQFLIVRHTRRDVGRELPTVVRVPQTIDADARALDAVEASAAQLAKIILAKTAEAYKGERLHASEQISVLLRQATGISKAPYVADFVRLLVESGEKVVLCGWHREVYTIWQSKLKDLAPTLYTGTEDANAKAEAVRRFTQSDSKVLILSLRSGAGLNGLQDVSSVIVFGELDWSPGVHEQCIGRLNRDGQTSPVVAYFLVSETGSDPVVAETLGLKREQVEGLRDPAGALLDELQTDGTHARRLAEHYLASIAAGGGSDAPTEQQQEAEVTA